LRRDVKRNLRALLDATGEVVRQDPHSFSMQAVAARAGLAPSTAWRHFSSIEDLIHAYAKQQAEDLVTATSDLPDGADRFHETVTAWVEIVLRSGPALVQFRSKRGYIERSRGDDDILEKAREAWTPALRTLLLEMGLGEAELESALFLSNTISDPREILDLHLHANMTTEEIIARLEATLRGAIAGWASVSS